MTHSLKDPASAGSFRVRPLIRVVAFASLFAFLGACVSPFDDTSAPPEESGELDRSLAEPADELDSEQAGSTTTTDGSGSGGSAGTGSGTGSGDGGSGNGGSGGADPPPAPGERRLKTVPDERGDAGAEAPKHGDLVSLVLTDTGTRLRAVVVMAGGVPRQLRDGETMGVGVDLYRSSQAESDFQLFADGGSDGWYAYLHTPKGLREYPGSFAVGSDRLVFEVPWDTIGGKRGGGVSVFADWSLQRLAVLASASADRAPDSGRVAFAV